MNQYIVFDRHGYQVGLSTYQTLREVEDYVEWLRGEHFDERWALALQEEVTERQTGNMTNWERYNFREFKDKFPVSIWVRTVSEWRPAD